MRNHWFLMISIGCGHISNPLENKSNSSTQQLLIPQKNAILVYYQEHWWSYDMIQRLIFEARILENHCHENYWRVKCYIVSYIISYGTAVPIVLHPPGKLQWILYYLTYSCLWSLHCFQFILLLLCKQLTG